MRQQGDVVLFQSLNDGDIIVEDGLALMDGGLQTSLYLSLFGGNEDDDGLADNDKTWWANLDENQPVFRYRSRLQNLLKSIPATSNNLIRAQDAALADLQWLLDDNVASSVTVTATIPQLNRLKLVIEIQAVGEESSFEYVANWRASS